ncbi:hypothetical protein AD951_00980 [Acetobacter malorum]|uniref:Uncharacterized protein n=1 Tax=Acetobacter malorum TaxID=178901 RepID=A0A149UZL4_9PROT|nr:hypothetical protein AD951_00980 [Acetobacter malorum]
MTKIKTGLKVLNKFDDITTRATIGICRIPPAFATVVYNDDFALTTAELQVFGRPLRCGFSVKTIAFAF